MEGLHDALHNQAKKDNEWYQIWRHFPTITEQPTAELQGEFSRGRAGGKQPEENSAWKSAPPPAPFSF